MELELVVGKYYRVKRGQTLASVCKVFRIPPAVLILENGLKEELFEGQVLVLPKIRRNLYTVKGSESKTLLCGTPARFKELNATEKLYIGQTVYLG